MGNNSSKDKMNNINDSSNNSRNQNNENNELFYQIWRNKYLKLTILRFSRIINNNLIYDNKSDKFKDCISSTVIKFSEIVDEYIDNSNLIVLETTLSNLSPALQKIEFKGICTNVGSKLKQQKYENIKWVKFRLNSGSVNTNLYGDSVFLDYVSIFPNLVHVEFTYLNYCGPLLEKMKCIETLIYSDDFNTPIIYLPPNLKFLKTGNSYNQTINLKTISHVKSIQFGNHFNQPIFNIPNDNDIIQTMSLTSLVFGNSYTCSFSSRVLQVGLANLKHLNLGNNIIIKNLYMLPSNLESLTTANKIQEEAIKSCVNTLQSIEFPISFNNEISNLKFAKNLKSIKFGVQFNKSLWKDGKCQLPKSITKIVLSSYTLDQNFGFDETDLRKDLPNLKTIVFNQNPVTLFKKGVKLPNSLNDIRCIVTNLQTFKLFLCSGLPVGSITFNRIKVESDTEIEEFKSFLKSSPIRLDNPDTNLKFISFYSCASLIPYIPISSVESIFINCNLNSIHFIFDQLKQQKAQCKNLYISIKSTELEINDQELELQLPESIVNLYLLNFQHPYKINNAIQEDYQISKEVNLISKLYKSILAHSSLHKIYCLVSNTGFINYSIDNDFYHLLKLTNKNQILNTLDYN